MKYNKITMLGTGIMGFQMARRLAEAGHKTAAWNRTEAKAEPLQLNGVKVHASAQKAVEGADCVILMVADGPATDALLAPADISETGILNALAPSATVLVMSSIPIETAQSQAQRCADGGHPYMDAPVSGGEPGATDGTLAIMAGGSPDTFENLSGIFSVFGRATLLGPVGTGSLAKLANQVIVGNTISAVAEALILVEQGGGDPAALVSALKGGFADSNILQNHGRRMATGDFRAGAPSRIQHKDMKSANELAGKLGLKLTISKLVEGLYADMCRHGLEDADHNAAYIEIRRRNELPDKHETSK